MKIKVSYYIPVEKEIEMTPEQYCNFHADGTLNGKKVIPENAIREETFLTEEAQEELDSFLFENSKSKTSLLEKFRF